MARTVYTLCEYGPEFEDEATQARIRWCEEQGIDPHSVNKYGFRIDLEDDGTLTAHYLVFDRDESVQGAPFTVEDYPGPSGGYRKHPESRRVTSLPPL